AREHGVSREQVLASAASPPREPVIRPKSGMPRSGQTSTKPQQIRGHLISLPVPAVGTGVGIPWTVQFPLPPEAGTSELSLKKVRAMLCRHTMFIQVQK